MAKGADKRPSTLRPAHINTKDNLADLFTKPLDRKTFQGLRNVLMNITP